LQEYELCLLCIEDKDTPRAVEYKWGIWKRYSNFEELDK